MIEDLQIELTRGQVTRVSAEDFEELSRYKWQAMARSDARGFYAVRSHKVDGKKIAVLMARQIMGSPVGMEVDHINGDTLDNRRSNLRLTTHSQNCCNRITPSNNTSGFRGVYWHKYARRWHSAIQIEKKRFNLGLHDTPEEAHAAYCEAAKKHHGEFARRYISLPIWAVIVGVLYVVSK